MGTTAIDALIAGQAGASGQPPAGNGGVGSDAAGNAGEAGGGPGAGGTGADQAFDRSKLSPVLQNLNAEQMNDLFLTLTNGLRSASPPAPAAQPAARAEPEKPPYTKEELKKYFDPASPDFDPEGAVAMIANKNYGPLLSDINERASVGVFANLRSTYPDFQEFEQDIRGAMKGRDPASVSEREILGAYLTLKGAKVTRNEMAERARQKGTSTQRPTPRAEEAQTVVLSDYLKNVAHKMFPNLSHADAEAKYILHSTEEDAPTQGRTLKVPIGRDAQGKPIYA